MAQAAYSPRLAARVPRGIGFLPKVLLPNLSAAIAVATVGYCLLLYGAGEQFFRDSDSGWHIRNGERILAERRLPATDPFSFSKPGEQWFAWEWGSDVIMALAHRADSLRGVTILFAFAIFACTWMWCRLHFTAGGDFFLVALFAPLMVTTVSLHWLARPHIFGWVFLLAAMLYAELPHVRFRLWHLAAIAGVAALWANVHASFFLAPVIAVVYATSHAIRPLVWPLDTRLERHKAGWFIGAGLAALAGSLANPYGWRLHAHLLAYVTNDELLSHVAEFQSFNFHQPDAVQVALTLLVGLAGGVLALGQQKLAVFFLAGLFGWGALRSARVLPLVALVLLPLANGVFTQALHRTYEWKPAVSKAVNTALAYSERLRLIDARLSAVAFSAIILVLLATACRSPLFAGRVGFAADRFPVAASAALAGVPPEARILAPDSYGGYLIYRFRGERKVFFDGRSDFYGAAFMKDYLVLINGQPGWKDIVHRFGFTHALLPERSPLKAALEQAGWTVRYRDNVATLLEAR